MEDAERSADESVKKYEKYVNSLKAEIKARKLLLTALDQAEVFYRTQRGEVKILANVSIKIKQLLSCLLKRSFFHFVGL